MIKQFMKNLTENKFKEFANQIEMKKYFFKSATSRREIHQYTIFKNLKLELFLYVVAIFTDNNSLVSDCFIIENIDDYDYIYEFKLIGLTSLKKVIINWFDEADLIFPKNISLLLDNECYKSYIFYDEIDERCFDICLKYQNKTVYLEFYPET